MLNHLRTPDKCRISAYAPYGWRFLPALVLIPLLFQSACGKRGKAEFAPAEPARIAFLPLNVPGEQKDLQWVAIAAPILLAQVCERAPDLQAVPFWESMPVAVQSAGASRIFVDESAESAASWLSAEWGAMGEVSPGRRKSISFILDFIPVGPKQIPFRYMKTARIETLANGFPTAFTQFLRYLAARPLDRKGGDNPKLSSMKAVAEALDREYGWFVEPEPGNAHEIVDELMQRDEDLARFLFSSNTYPQLKTDAELNQTVQ